MQKYRYDLDANVIEGPDGKELQILRDNMHLGNVGSREFSTYFISYCGSPRLTETMLEHMFIGDPPGKSDRILDFSTAITGSLFFVPTADFLKDPPLPDYPVPSMPKNPSDRLLRSAPRTDHPTALAARARVSDRRRRSGCRVASRGSLGNGTLVSMEALRSRRALLGDPMGGLA